MAGWRRAVELTATGQGADDYAGSESLVGISGVR